MSSPAPALGAPGQLASDCELRCVRAAQMQARAIEAIEADCRRACAAR